MKGKFRHMPVLDTDRLVGLVSIGDALKWQIETIRERLRQLEESLVEFELMRLQPDPLRPKASNANTSRGSAGSAAASGLRTCSELAMRGRGHP